MKLDTLVDMAKETAAFGVHPSGEFIYSFYTEQLQAFAALVASAERERIKQANAPEIERINAYIKEALAQREQDGQCKHCTDGCPACDARKLPKETHDLF